MFYRSSPKLSDKGGSTKLGLLLYYFWQIILKYSLVLRNDVQKCFFLRNFQVVLCVESSPGCIIIRTFSITPSCHFYRQAANHALRSSGLRGRIGTTDQAHKPNALQMTHTVKYHISYI